MIREEEIDKAAEKFAFSDKTETSDFHDIINDFYYGAKWADKTMIDKACEWLNMNIIDYVTEGSREGISLENHKQLIDDFRKAMEK